MINTKKDIEKKQIFNRVINEMGGSVEEYIQERNNYLVDLAGKKMLLELLITITRDPYVGVISTRCKDVTCKLLAEASLPIPDFESFYYSNYDKETVYKKLNRMNYPIILKHATGSNSRGLFVNILNSKEAIKILEKQLKILKTMIAQEMVYGKEYRILVLGDKVIAALEMIHPHVVGDGVSKLRSLIKKRQNTTDQKTKLDKQLKWFVMKQGFSLEDIVPKGKTIFYKGICCLAEGGGTKDVTDIVHKDVVDICVKASEVVGKNLVGIDIICKDVSKKQSKKSISILEINSKPNLYRHYNPDKGKARNVLKDVLDFITK